MSGPDVPRRVFDARVRPPYGSFVGLSIFPPPGPAEAPRVAAGPGLTRIGVVDEPSVRERSLDAFLAELDANRIERALVHGRSAGGRYGSVDNDDVLALVEAHGPRLLGLVGVPAGDPDRAVAEIERCAAVPGVRGVAVDPGWQDPPLVADDPVLDPVYDACQARGLAVAVVSSVLAGPDLDASNPVHVERVARRFRKLRLAVVHGSYPWVTHMLSVVIRCPNVWVVPDFYHHTPGLPGAAEWAVGANGIARHRLVYGSGYPVRPLGQSIAEFLGSGVDPSVLDDVMWRNACELLAVDP